MISSLGAIRRSRRRAAVAAEDKIRKLADDEEAEDIDEEEAAKKNMDGSNQSRTLQDTKRKRAAFSRPGDLEPPNAAQATATNSRQDEPQTSGASSTSSSALSPFSSLSTSSSELSDSSGCCGDGERSTGGDDHCDSDDDASVDGVSSSTGAYGIASSMTQRVAHQRRRVRRQINSSGTMYLSGRSRHRIDKDRKKLLNDAGVDLSPIVARTLQLTPVANIPTTPASRYRFTTATTAPSTKDDAPLATAAKSAAGSTNIEYLRHRSNGATSRKT